MTSINASAIALAERYARDYFGLSLPLTQEELKSAFRRVAKELHTDTGGDKDKFIAMKEAYDFLVNLNGMDFVYGSQNQPQGSLKTTDGTLLCELGLGLGPMKNGRECERCDRRGYTEESEPDYFGSGGYCMRCDLFGRVHVVGACRPCNGTGKFRQRRTGRLVTCRVCVGSGRLFSAHRICSDCNGSKKRILRNSKMRYVKCYECNGTGEIELFSPLFPKGRLINKVTIR